MNSNRPKNLDLTTIQLPLPAKASILHRISGFALFFAVAFMLYALQMSLESEQAFGGIQDLMDHWLAKLITWGILSALGYHLIAGVKHLLMDWGVGETKESGRVSAMVTLIAGFVVIALAGVWVW